MLKLKSIDLVKQLKDIPVSKTFANIQINTINAHSYNVAQKDSLFSEVLLKSDFLLPDGQSVVWAKKWLTGDTFKRIAGYDLFIWEMERINKSCGKCFFLGSTESTLSKITEKVNREYPQISITVFSPPYKPEFSEEDNLAMIEKINSFEPDVLFVGMTAPKQEKWVYNNAKYLKTGHICSIGAVFDFYVGNIKRASAKWQNLGLEWLYRLISEPKRMWRRYILGNTKFVWYIIKEKMD